MNTFWTVIETDEDEITEPWKTAYTTLEGAATAVRERHEELWADAYDGESAPVLNTFTTDDDNCFCELTDQAWPKWSMQRVTVKG